MQCGLWLTGQIIFFCWTFRVTNKLIVNLVEFHQFLTSYRQTPRSRIFKKNMPTAENGRLMPIMEEDSFLEHSVAQSIVNGKMSISKGRKSVMSTRFVYGEHLVTYEEEVVEGQDLEEQHFSRSFDQDIF